MPQMKRTDLDGQAKAVLVQRSMRGRDQPRVVAQAQVVFGACRRQLRQLCVCQAAVPWQG